MRARAIWITSVAFIWLTAPAAISVSDAQDQAPADQPEAVPQKIVVASVQGSVRYSRDNVFHELTTKSELTQGDTLVSEAAGVCKLEFRHPTSGALLSAVVVRGYTEMT